MTSNFPCAGPPYRAFGAAISACHCVVFSPTRRNAFFFRPFSCGAFCSGVRWIHSRSGGFPTVDHRPQRSPSPRTTTPQNSFSSSSVSSTSNSVPLLLQHLHRSLFQIDRLYAQQSEMKSSHDARGRPSEEAPCRSALVGDTVPPDPATPEQGEAIVEFFCRELEMGSKPLRMWREGIRRRMCRKWVCSNEKEDACQLSSPCPLFLEHVARRVPFDVWEQARQVEHNMKNVKEEGKERRKSFLSGRPSNGHKNLLEAQNENKEPEEGRSDQLFFYPRPQDTAFVHSCIHLLKAVISPFLTLSPPPRTMARRRYQPSSGDPHESPAATAATSPSRHGVGDTTPFLDASKEDDRPYTYDSCSTFYATQFIPAGMCVMSIPTAAGFFLHPSLSSLSSTMPWSTSSSSSSSPPMPQDGVEVGSPDTSPLASSDAHQDRKEVSWETARACPSRDVEEVDAYVLYFQQLDDLVGQMLFAADPPEKDSDSSCVEAGQRCRREDQKDNENGAVISNSSEPSPPHTSFSSSASTVSPLAGYLSYLKESVVPCKNLPFIRTKEQLWEILHPYALEGEHGEKNAAPQRSTENHDNGSEKRRKKSRALGATPTKEWNSQDGGHPLSSFGATTPSSSFPASISTETTKKEEKKRQTFQNSAAYALWSFFHEEMKGQPLSSSLREYFQLPPLTPTPSSSSPSSSATSSGLSVYHWWLSVVLSRRLGASCVMPLVDKLNHSPLPNCYYTMAAPVPVEESDTSLSSSPFSSSKELMQSMTGLDVFHNLVAGVSSVYLYEPYFHVFALRDIHPGEALTLCYQAPSHHLYRSAHTLSVSSAFSEGNEDVVTTTAALLARASALRLRHPGTSCVDTLEGQGSWQLQWGFAPNDDAFFSAQDLIEMGTLLTEKRVEERKVLFSLSS